MPRRQEPFSVVRRPGSSNWHYELGSWKIYKSGGKTTKAGAVMPGERSQRFGNREHELAVPQLKKHVVDQMLGE